MSDAGGAGRVLRRAGGLAAAALALLALGLAVDATRALLAWLAAWAAGVSVGLGALTLILIADVTGARWFAPFRRAAGILAAAIPLFALLFLPIALGLEAIYPWAGEIEGLPKRLQHHVEQTRAYLNVPFFLARSALVLALWSVLGLWAARREEPRGPGASGAALIVLALTLHFAAVDWVMSLAPVWHSTIFGLYFWSGGFVAALGAVALLSFAGARAEPAPAEAEHAALGKMLLTFLVWWAYLGFSQYLIIWMANIPAEISWYLPRTAGVWGAIAVALVLGHFAFPLLVLLPRAAKRRPRVLAAVGGVLLLVHWLDVWWQVLPGLRPSDLGGIWMDVAAVLAVAGLTLAYASWQVQRTGGSVQPAGEPEPEVPSGGPAAGPA